MERTRIMLFWTVIPAIALLLGLPGCGQPQSSFVPPLLMDTAGLSPRVELDPDPLELGQQRLAVFSVTSPFKGHLIGLPGGVAVDLQLESLGPSALALYGPRRADGLFGEVLAWSEGRGGRVQELAATPISTGGDYLVLVAGLDGAAGSYGLLADCAGGCAPPVCDPLVCGLYCPTGLARDQGGCPVCSCADGCLNDTDCPLSFSCLDGVCRADDDPCACQGEPYQAVCGQDGNTYANACELECAQIPEEHSGPCESPGCTTDAECPAGMICTAAICVAACDCTGVGVDPVCGTDGLTYPNDCERLCAEVGLDHQGSCDQCIPEICGDAQDNDCDGFADEGCGLPCAQDADCLAGELCLDGACAPALACTSNVDCPAGQVCESGLCRIQGNCSLEICDGLDNDCDGLVDEGCPACRSNSDCQVDEICVEGQCVGDCIPGTEICDGFDNDCDGLVDEDFDLQNDPANCGSCENSCAAGEMCAGGICATVPDCSSDADCPPGQVCIAGQCEPDCDVDGDGYLADTCGGMDCHDSDATIHPGAPEDCNGLDDDCDGEVDEGCIANCASDADCSPGEVCIAGQCMVDCDRDGDGHDSFACGGDDCDDLDPMVHPGMVEVCDNGQDDDCDGQVDEDCNDACTTDADCAAGQTCESNVCRAGCSSDSDCSAGEICWTGFCAIPCSSDSECPAGQTCNVGERICYP